MGRLPPPNDFLERRMGHCGGGARDGPLASGPDPACDLGCRLISRLDIHGDAVAARHGVFDLTQTSVCGLGSMSEGAHFRGLAQHGAKVQAGLCIAGLLLVIIGPLALSESLRPDEKALLVGGAAPGIG